MIQIAHRGYSQLCKDNSMESILQAMHHNFDMIEIDIQLSLDNILVVYHDNFINDYTLNMLTYDEIVKLDSSIITLSDVFTIPNIHTHKIYLDIKGTDETICDWLYEQIKDCNLENIYIGSTNILFLQKLNCHKESIQLGFITSNLFNSQFLEKEIVPICDFICFEISCLEQSLIHRLKHKYKIQIFVYTNINLHTYNYIRHFDVDGIVTKYKL